MKSRYLVISQREDYFLFDIIPARNRLAAMDLVSEAREGIERVLCLDQQEVAKALSAMISKTDDELLAKFKDGQEARNA